MFVHSAPSESLNDEFVTTVMPAGSLCHCPPTGGADTVTAHVAELLLYVAVMVAEPAAGHVISNKPEDCPAGITMDARTDAIAPFVDDNDTVEFVNAALDRFTRTEFTVLV